MSAPEAASTTEQIERPKRPIDRRAAEASLEGLRELFLRFRRQHRAGSRIPQRLRDAVLVALGRGVTAAELARVCGVSLQQVDLWRHSGMKLPEDVDPEPASARVFSVVEDAPPNVETEVGDVVQGSEVELRFPGWSILIRPATGQP